MEKLWKKNFGLGKFLVQDKVQVKVGLRKFLLKSFFSQKALKCHVQDKVDGEIVKKKFPF